MIPQRATTFQEALDVVESLPDDQQQDLIEIVRRRRRDSRRDALAASVARAREDYARGEVRRGSVDDLLRELDE